jgi:hypothetical protein
LRCGWVAVNPEYKRFVSKTGTSGCLFFFVAPLFNLNTPPFYLLPIVSTAALSAADLPAYEVKSGHLARLLLHLIERYLISYFL